MRPHCNPFKHHIYKCMLTVYREKDPALYKALPASTYNKNIRQRAIIRDHPRKFGIPLNISCMHLSPTIVFKAISTFSVVAFR